MPIKLSDEARISDLLSAVNGHSRSHTYTAAYQLRAIALDAEKRLEELGIPKKDRIGAVIVSQSGSKLPSAYKYTATTTTVCLKRRSSEWYLVEAYRSSLWPREAPDNDLKLTPKQDAIAIGKLRQRYSIPRPIEMVSL